jgi:hypothetical protein
VSTTPAINLCHGFSVIGGVVDTGNKFITGVVDTAEQFSPVTTTAAINLCLVSTKLLNNDHGTATKRSITQRLCPKT